MADSVQCPACSIAYSFFFVTNKHDPEFIRSKIRAQLKSAHPDHETLIRVPEDQEEEETAMNL